MIFQIVFLSIVWFILAGCHSTIDIVFGIISVCITCFISKKMKIKSPFTSITLNGIIYFMWLYYEMIKSSFFVACKIWQISPKTRTLLLRDLLLTDDKVVNMIISESITFTPGTATILYDKENSIIVHCIDHSLKNGVYSIVEKVKKHFCINKDL